MSSPICHLEIKVTNMARAKKFYGKLLGWKFHAMSPGYVRFNPGKGPGGALDRVKKVSANGGARPYFHVKSIETALATAGRMRAKVIQPKVEIGGGHGFMAIIHDSEGNEIGLWNKR